MKFHLNSNIVEGTPEELVKYQELLEGLEEEREAELLKSGHMHQSSEEEALNNFQGLLGSLKVKDSYTESTEISTDEDKPMGYTFWYIDGTQGRNLNVLKATLDGDFEDSTGTRYTHQAVSGLIKPLDREDAREKFEKAENYECLLKYYPTVDVFAWK